MSMSFFIVYYASIYNSRRTVGFRFRLSYLEFRLIDPQQGRLIGLEIDRMDQTL